MVRNKFRLLAFPALLGIVMASQAPAAIIYSTPGSTYNQNFNTLPHLANLPGTSQHSSLGNSPAGWKNDDPAPPTGNFSIVGWHLLHPLTPTEGGFNGNQRMRWGTGSGSGGSTGSFYSYGTGGNDSDRALGIVNATTLTNPSSANGNFWAYMGAVFTNTTGQVLDSFTLSYNGEQWRNSGDASKHKLEFQYSLTASNVQSLTAYTSVPALDFEGPLSGGAVQGGVGNGAGRVAIGPVTVTGLNWQPGANLWIRWRDFEDGGSVDDHGLAIDDVVFSADVAQVQIPEPAGLVLFGLASCGLLALARRR